jgi:hypothetical protein
MAWLTRRDFFWYCAGVLSVVAVGFLVHALNGARDSGAPPELAAHGAAMPAPGEEAAPRDQRAGSMEEMLARLEARLAAQGGTDADWELLAQTYEFVGRTDDAKLARAHQLSPSAMTNAEPSATTDAAAPSANSAANSAAGSTPGEAQVQGNIDVAGTLKSKVPDGLTLFIVAKSVDSPGPPLAIIRTTTGHWPLAFKLDDSNAMMPGRNLSAAQRITVEARVSRSGMATPQSGDFQSSIATIDPHQSTAVRIVIDHVIS